MTGEAEHFLPNRILETVGKCKSDEHRHHADGRGEDGQPDNKAGKRLLFVKDDPFRNKCRCIQRMVLSFKNRIT